MKIIIGLVVVWSFCISFLIINSFDDNSRHRQPEYCRALDEVVNLWHIQSRRSIADLLIGCASLKQWRLVEDIAWHPLGSSLFHIERKYYVNLPTGLIIVTIIRDVAVDFGF